MNTCRYLSTRGKAPAADFEQVLLCGTARDGGLYVPEYWPAISAEQIRSLRGCSYLDCARTVFKCFGIDGATSLLDQAYSTFDHQAIAPLIQCDGQIWLMELFHGPTLSFKDIALQVLTRLLESFAEQQQQTRILVGATSGDTGSAAVEAVRARKWLELVMLHPKGRTSEIQRRQMTCVIEPNIHNIALDGSFDDCQRLIKQLFAVDHTGHLSAVNSINWCRIVVQIVYYLWAAVSLGAPERQVSFAVPTGNFGNVYAAFAARAMGIPIARLVIGNNSNDGLVRFISKGQLMLGLQLGPVIATFSPSMDIQVPSNLERFLFELYSRNGQALAQAMYSDQPLALTPDQLQQFRAIFWGWTVNDHDTCATIRQIYQRTGMVIDPHTAVGLAAARAAIDQKVVPADTPVVALGCAHPAKFPQVVEQAIGHIPSLPKRLADLHLQEEQYHTLPNDQQALVQFVQRLRS